MKGATHERLCARAERYRAAEFSDFDAPTLETTYPFSRSVSVNSLIALGAYLTARMVQSLLDDLRHGAL